MTKAEADKLVLQANQDYYASPAIRAKFAGWESYCAYLSGIKMQASDFMSPEAMRAVWASEYAASPDLQKEFKNESWFLAYKNRSF